MNDEFRINLRRCYKQYGRDSLDIICKTILNITMTDSQLDQLNNMFIDDNKLLRYKDDTNFEVFMIFNILLMLMNKDIRIIFVGEGLRVCSRFLEYGSKIWENSDVLKILYYDRKDGPHREVDRYIFKMANNLLYMVPFTDSYNLRGFRGDIIQIKDDELVDTDLLKAGFLMEANV